MKCVDEKGVIVSRSCPKCQTLAPDGAVSCAKCGFAFSTAPSSSKSSFRFDRARLSQADQITGVASLILLISLYLPWFGIGVLGFSYTVDGVSADGYLYITFLLTVALLVYLLVRAGWDSAPFTMPLSHYQVMLFAPVINLVLVVLAFFIMPSGIGVGWRLGAFLGLVAAVVAALPLGLPAVRARQGTNKK